MFRFLTFFTLFFTSVTVSAQEIIVDDSALDENVTAVYGTACESIREDEARSSARVRVTDKASFMAVQGINGLEDFKKEINDHDFNVLIYSLVDNYLEDMAIRTTKQDEKQICVEVTGYIQKNNIVKAINDTLQKSTAPDEEQEFETNPHLEEILTEATEKSKENTPPGRKIYLAPTKFFNETETEAYRPLLEKSFSALGLLFSDGEMTADYVIRSNVLRAKVDPINKDTSRLQMVVSMEMEIRPGGDKMTSHQNRFVLFTAETGEQEAARKLLEKLFIKAAEELSVRIEAEEQKHAPGLPSVITPTSH